MKIFGWSIIRTADLDDYESYKFKRAKLAMARRWFSGWVDLDIIWDYLANDNYFGGIESAREEYARARGTTVYGVEK